LALIVVLALAKWDWSIEDLVRFRGDIGVKVVPAGRVPANAGHLGDSNIGAQAVSSAIVRSYAPWLIIDYEVTDRRFNLAKVRLWEMISFFGQIVID
jgi:hypothetical protein